MLEIAAGTMAVFLGIAALRRSFIVATVVGESMSPTLRDGDRVLVLRRRGDRLTRGAIVLLRAPGHPEAFRASDDGWRIKRIVAVGGDGVPPALRAAVAGSVVPDGAVLVLGDNVKSQDSRSWGSVPVNRLAGEICFAWRAGLLAVRPRRLMARARAFPSPPSAPAARARGARR
jgi:signal peptidase I